MARPPLATVDDLHDALGTPVSGSDVKKALSLLGRASAIVRAFAGKTWVDDQNALEDVPEDIPGVVVSMVERATRNPDGYTQETAGPFSRSFGSEAAQRLFMTSMEKLVIRAACGSTGISVLPTTRGDLETPSVVDYGLDLPEEDLDTLTGLLQ